MSSQEDTQVIYQFPLKYSEGFSEVILCIIASLLKVNPKHTNYLDKAQVSALLHVYDKYIHACIYIYAHIYRIRQIMCNTNMLTMTS